VGKLK